MLQKKQSMQWSVAGLGLLMAVLCSPLSTSAADDVVTEDGYTFPELWDEEKIIRRQIKYADGKTNLTAYISYYNTTEKKPVVMVIPDADGISAYEKWRADLLADMGYIGFVADVYGDKVKQGPQMSLERRQELVNLFANNADMYKGRLMTSLNVVRGLKIAAPGKVAAVGYSSGGLGAIQLMRAWPDTDGLSGVVSFHGAPLWMKNFTPAATGNPIRVAIFNGASDAANKDSALTEFRAELDSANVTWQWMDFGGAVSGFSQPDRPLLLSSEQLIAYNPSADVMSWFALRGFLLDLFGYVNPQNSYTASNYVSDYQTGFTAYASPAGNPAGTIAGTPAANPPAAVIQGVAVQSTPLVTGAGR
eukprot:jgi/Botrbrau1/19684/Bobra.0003s0046.1